MDHLKSIRSKLSKDEVAFISRKFGVDLSHADLEEQIAAVAELESLSRKIEAVQSKAASADHAQQIDHPSCAFCGGGSAERGPLAQSRRGVSICRACAHECIASIDKETPSDA